MSVLYPYVDEELAAELEAQGIEVVDCRVSGEWAEVWVQRETMAATLEAAAPRRKRAAVLQERASRSAAARVPTITVPERGRRFTTYDWLMMDPHYREAAERGKEIHEAALALVEEKGISYEEAIGQVAE